MGRDAYLGYERAPRSTNRENGVPAKPQTPRVGLVTMAYGHECGYDMLADSCSRAC
jgi:hypothetical protein